MGNNESSGGSRDSDQCYSGHGGAVCSVPDVIAATSASNALSDDSGVGNQLSAAVIGGQVRWACGAENITGTTQCKREYDPYYGSDKQRSSNWVDRGS
jgi:hypothetical protein